MWQFCYKIKKKEKWLIITSRKTLFINKQFYRNYNIFILQRFYWLKTSFFFLVSSLELEARLSSWETRETKVICRRNGCVISVCACLFTLVNVSEECPKGESVQQVYVRQRAMGTRVPVTFDASPGSSIAGESEIESGGRDSAKKGRWNSSRRWKGEKRDLEARRRRVENPLRIRDGEKRVDTDGYTGHVSRLHIHSNTHICICVYRGNLNSE